MVQYKNKKLAIMLMAPQVLIVAIFLYYPLISGMIASFHKSDPFGLSRKFVGFDNYIAIFSSANYLHSLLVTLIIAFAIASITTIIALIAAYYCDKALRFQGVYRTVLIIPFAVAAPAISVVFDIMFFPDGIITRLFTIFGLDLSQGNVAPSMILVITISVWNRLSFNFIFLIAALQMMPKSILEASILEGAGEFRRLVSVIIPLISPTIFFLYIVNLIAGVTETFSVIDLTTQGGPSGWTMTIVYHMFLDRTNINSSSAESVVLLFGLGALIFAQFRFFRKKVHYE